MCKNEEPQPSPCNDTEGSLSGWRTSALPYMVNGSLLSYLRKEWSNLTFKLSVTESDSIEEENQSLVSIIILNNLADNFLRKMIAWFHKPKHDR